MKVDDFCRTFGVECIYHFTDEANLPSIRLRGLVPYRFLKDRPHWGPVRPGGSKSSHVQDSRSGFDRYVHLCFTMDHPMSHQALKEGRITSLVWVEVSCEVLHRKGVLGCKTLANTNGAEVVPIEQALDMIDLPTLFGAECPVSVRKAQILVPGSIPVSKLRVVGHG